MFWYELCKVYPSLEEGNPLIEGGEAHPVPHHPVPHHHSSSTQTANIVTEVHVQCFAYSTYNQILRHLVKLTERDSNTL